LEKIKKKPVISKDWLFFTFLSLYGIILIDIILLNKNLFDFSGNKSRDTMLKLAKAFPKTGAVETKKSGFYFSSGNIIRAAITAGVKQEFILNSIDKVDETDLHRLMLTFNVEAKACKTACVFIRDNALFYGFNHDCGIAIFNKGGNLIYQTPNNSQFGVFSGRRSYEAFISTGVIPVEKGDTVILYSGSFDKIVNSLNFYRILFDKKFEKLIDDLVEKEKERKEKTLLVFSLD